MSETPDPQFVVPPKVPEYLKGPEAHLIPAPPVRKTQIDALTRRRMAAVWLREYLPRFVAIARGEPIRSEVREWVVRSDGTPEVSKHVITERSPTLAELLSASQQLIDAGLGRRSETVRLEDPGAGEGRAPMPPVVWPVPTQMPPMIDAKRDDLGAQIAALLNKSALPPS